MTAPITVPVTLLVDSGTSGPAEVFAAALAGNKRAELIGERTIGRTGVQELVKLPDGSGSLDYLDALSHAGRRASFRPRASSPTWLSTSPKANSALRRPRMRFCSEPSRRLSTKKAA